MPEIKLDPQEAKRGLRLFFDAEAAAWYCRVDVSTMYRFIKDEGISIYFLRMEKKHGISKVVQCMADLGSSPTSIAHALAVTPQYINQVLGKSEKAKVKSEKHALSGVEGAALKT